MKKSSFLLILALVLSISFVLAAGSSTGSDETAKNNLKNVCESSGGAWRDDSCTNKCNVARATLNGVQAALCSRELGCVCVEGKCWNGASCESVNRESSRPITTTEPTDDIRTTCEDITSVEGRIRCRMMHKAILTDSSSVVEEACRGRTGTINEEKCKALYNRLKENRCYNLENAVAKKRCFLKQSGININQGGTFRASPDESKRSYVISLLYDLQERIEKLQENGKITLDESANLVTKIVEIKQMILDGKHRSEVVPKIQEFRIEYKSIITEGEQ